MPSKMYNRARMTVTSTGTGALSLGVAVAGYQTFSSSGAQNNDTVSYTIEDGVNWEVGTGTFNSTNGTLSRTVTQSFNGTTYSTSAISVTTNAQVYITALAADIVVSGGALGTPSSATLTNATGLPLATGVTGTLPVANGGTGATTSTGTGSVVLNTSPTFTTSALFPAGTVSAPGISVSGDTNTGIYFPAADTIGFVEGGVESMRINSSGYVGIATTNPATLLDMFSGTLGAAGKARIGDFRTSSGNGFTIPAFEALGNRDDGNTTFEGRIGLAVRRSDGTALQSTALLGMVAFGGQVGTSTSYSAADLLYPASIKGVAEGAFTSSTAMPTAITFSTGSSGDDLTTANRTYGTERMRIDASGRVLISGGDTTHYDARLSVVSAASSQSTIQIRNPGQGTSQIGYAAIGSNLKIYNCYSQGTLATGSGIDIDQNGNVGIGTTSPNGRVHGRQDSAGGTTYTLIADNGAGGAGTNLAAVAFQNGGTQKASIRAAVYGNGYMAFHTDNDTEKMRIDSNGTFRVKGAGAAGSTDAFLVDGAAPASAARIDASGNLLVGTTSASGRLTVNAKIAIINGAQNLIDFRSQTNGNGFSVGRSIASDNANNFFIYDNVADATRFFIAANGETFVGGNTDNGAYNFQCNGTGVWGAGAYVNGSDERIKDNIQDISSCIDVVKSLRPVTFQYKPDFSKETSIQPGFIAQDLQQALAGQVYDAGVVMEGPQYLSVAYQALIPVLTKAIQELAAKVSALEAKQQ